MTEISMRIREQVCSGDVAQDQEGVSSSIFFPKSAQNLAHGNLFLRDLRVVRNRIFIGITGNSVSLGKSTKDVFLIQSAD